MKPSQIKTECELIYTQMKNLEDAMRKEGFIMRLIGERYGINRRHIGDILYGECWPHVYASINSGT